MEITRLVNRLFRSRLNPAGLLLLSPVYWGGRFTVVSKNSIVHSNLPGNGNIKEGSTVYRVCGYILAHVHGGDRVVDQQYEVGLKVHGFYLFLFCPGRLVVAGRNRIHGNRWLITRIVDL